MVAGHRIGAHPADLGGLRLPMRIVLHQPRREIEMDGPRSVKALLNRLDLVTESVLVIRGDELLTDDVRLHPDDVIEVRPVISGG